MDDDTKTLADYPFVVLGGAFALGVLAGYLVPISEPERRQFGPYRDQLVERARGTATEAVEGGKQALRDVVRGV
jgi:hypothetical protein